MKLYIPITIEDYSLLEKEQILSLSEIANNVSKIHKFYFTSSEEGIIKKYEKSTLITYKEIDLSANEIIEIINELNEKKDIFNNNLNILNKIDYSNKIKRETDSTYYINVPTYLNILKKDKDMSVTGFGSLISLSNNFSSFKISDKKNSISISETELEVEIYMNELNLISILTALSNANLNLNSSIDLSNIKLNNKLNNELNNKEIKSEDIRKINKKNISIVISSILFCVQNKFNIKDKKYTYLERRKIINDENFNNFLSNNGKEESIEYNFQYIDKDNDFIIKLIKEDNVLKILLNENEYFTFKYDENNRLFYAEKSIKKLIKENSNYINEEILFDLINDRISIELNNTIKEIKNKPIKFNMNF